MLIFAKLLNNKWFYIAVILILLFLLFSGFGRQSKTLITTITKTDTVFVNKPYKQLVIKEVIKPKKVYVYKTDTIYRERIIRDKLIVGLQLRKNSAELHTLTPDGIPNINQYLLPEFEQISIDHKGNLQIQPVKHPNRKRNLQILKNVGIFVGGVLIGVKIAE